MALRPVNRHVTLIRSTFRNLVVEVTKAINVNSQHDPETTSTDQLRQSLENLYIKAVELFDTELRDSTEIRYDASLCCGLNARIDFATGVISLGWKKHDMGKVIECVLIVHNEHDTHADAASHRQSDLVKTKHKTLYETV